ncbi:MAG: deoxyribodipyrimidine photo-lyase [Anaerolineae bacterium]
MTTAIWWIRRDLRLTDNQALTLALQNADEVIPVFVLDPALLASSYVGSRRLAFLLEGLRCLDVDLRARGSRLILRQGDPAEELGVLRAESNAGLICAEEDVSPYARRRDARVARDLPLQLVNGLTVHPAGAILKGDGTPYMVFTPFSRAWKASPLPGAGDILPAPHRILTPRGLASLPIPDQPGLPPGVPFLPGEAEALQRLGRFVDGEAALVFGYAEGRNRLDMAATSGLSPYLRLGMISARQAVVAALAAIEAASHAQARKGAETWLNELIWREFYVNILYHFPHVRHGSFRPEYDAIRWDNDGDAFSAWGAGRTGYPVVDAAMRQLAETGWMHNRARMIVASFLVKDLLIDWRWGERWFMQHLVDGDPAANNGGWQWTAGTGTDAAPYFRVFNPVAQGRKFDPEGAFVRRWLPELERVPARYIHEPWKMSPEEQRQAGCTIGEDYAGPIVDHAWARQRVLSAYARARGRG